MASGARPDSLHQPHCQNTTKINVLWNYPTSWYFMIYYWPSGQINHAPDIYFCQLCLGEFFEKLVEWVFALKQALVWCREWQSCCSNTPHPYLLLIPACNCSVGQFQQWCKITSLAAQQTEHSSIKLVGLEHLWPQKDYLYSAIAHLGRLCWNLKVNLEII